jgi:hypothetical protein
VNAPPIPVELRSIVDLLPAPVIEVRLMARVGQPWFVRYGSERTVLRWNDPKRFPHSDLAMESIAWLHTFLRDLARSGFRAPAPVPHLRGESVAIIDGAIWELLTFVPGRSIGWADNDGLLAAHRRTCQQSRRARQSTGPTPTHRQRLGVQAHGPAVRWQPGPRAASSRGSRPRRTRHRRVSRSEVA